MPEGLTVHRLIPLFKDWNEVLQHRAEITDGKYLREAIYGLKEPPQEETVEIIRMSEVDTQTCLLYTSLSGHRLRIFYRVPAFLPVSLRFSDVSGHNPVVVLSIVFYLDIPLS